MNLLNNAIDAIESAEEKKIKISANIEGQFLEIRVIDSGIGIPLEIQNKILQPFFTSKEIGKGTDLGLSLSLTIIKNYKGELYLDPEHKNTCFC
ncbi:MAG: GHKL domain-containing protein [Bacteriovorax sp.]|nr:GHKL domain-containing protein [Bacteriovorax sp.]